MLAMIFPGQGSQQRGMGGELFDLDEYTSVERQVDELVGYSLRQVCLEQAEKLSDTRYTQPCLYVVNALHYFKSVRDGRVPHLLAGHSLGEYNALLAAGVFDFLTGLRLVHKRGELMSQARNGAMAAVIGLEPSKVVEVMTSRGLDDIDVANYNSPKQVVISGPVAEVERAVPMFEAAGATLCIPLKVSGAFHSRCMESAARAFAEFIGAVTLTPPKIRVVSNVTGQFYPSEASSAVIASLLVRQIVRPVQWVQCVHRLLQAGATGFQETGPGNVLTRLVGQIRAVADAPAAA